jgi:hypothetical protein
MVEAARRANAYCSDIGNGKAGSHSRMSNTSQFGLAIGVVPYLFDHAKPGMDCGYDWLGSNGSDTFFGRLAEPAPILLTK